MIRHHMRIKFPPEIAEKVNASVDRDWLKSQFAKNAGEKVENAFMMESLMKGNSVNSFDFADLIGLEVSGDYSSSGHSCDRRKTCSDMSVYDMASDSSFVDVTT